MEEEKRKACRTHTTQTGPATSADSDSSHDATEHRLQQQKMEDEQLLLDAGITVDDMAEEEKQQILEALRESLPAPEDPISSTSGHTSKGAADQDEKEEQAELPEDAIPSPDAEPVQTLDVPPVQTLDVPSMEYDSDQEGTQECDSTTPSTPTRKAEGVSNDTRTGEREPDVVRRQTQQATESSVCNQAAGADSDADNLSDVSDTACTLDRDLLTRTAQRLHDQQSQSMKLSSRQKEQGQSRFKELYNKTNLALSQQSNSSLSSQTSAGNRGLSCSQDLFGDQPSGEDCPSQADVRQLDPNQYDDVKFDPEAKEGTLASTSAESVARKVPSPPLLPVQDSQPSVEEGGGEGGKEGMKMEDAETQPPEDLATEKEEDGTKSDVATIKEEEEDVQSSPVYPMQVTQASCSTPPPHCICSSDAHYITPSKLLVAKEEDCRPLLHDNWFSWPPVPPVCCLHRTYRMSSRMKKEPTADSGPYFCPERESAAAYSEVIVRMLDTYLQRFTAMQRCLHTLLPWGKPVRAGQHQSGSLDCKKRGQPAFRWQLDNGDDIDDFEAGQPPSKKPSIQQGGCEGSDGVADGGDNVSTVKMEVGAEDREDAQVLKVGDREDAATDVHDDRKDLQVFSPGHKEDTAEGVYDGETQALDSDSDLPDLVVEPAEAVGSSWSIRQEKQVSASPTTVSDDSQSSNSLLNEQGELYSTQLPRRKRSTQMQSVAAPPDIKRPRRMGTQAAMTIDEEREGPVKLWPLRRKRKQANSGTTDRRVHVIDDEDDDEVSFPQTKRVEVQRSSTRFIHISSVRAGRAAKAAVVRPQPHDGHATVTEVNSGGQDPIPSVPSSVSSSSDMKRGVREDSDNSVQYVEPSSHTGQAQTQTSPRRQPAGNNTLREGPADEEHDGDGQRPVAAASDASEPSDSASGFAELVACPLCNKPFPITVIERHASDCGLDIVPVNEPEVPPPNGAAALLGVPPDNQLKGRPLRSHLDREEFICSLCNQNQGGSGALKRHYEKCRQQQRDQGTSTSTQPFTLDTGYAGTALAPTKGRWLSAYKIPRKVEGASKCKRLPADAESSASEEENVIEEESDDSVKDPPFKLTEGDRKQEKEDMEEDREDTTTPTLPFPHRLATRQRR